MFPGSKSQSALWNTLTAGTGKKEKGKVERDIPDDPRRIEEILADELPATDVPEATEKTAVRFISLLLLWSTVALQVMRSCPLTGWTDLGTANVFSIINFVSEVSPKMN